MEKMRAIRIHEYGGPEVLRYEDIPLPTLEANEILVKIRAAGVNPVDWKMRQGYISNKLPLILGWDFAGDVVKVGKDVDDYQEGMAIFGHPSLMREGAYAEFIAVNSNEIALKPKTLTYEEAAVVPLSALTAWQALFVHANLMKGQKILVHAAAGGVGHYAIQLAKWAGAHVIGTASAKHEQFITDLGVNEFIDYTKVSFEDKLNDLDVVFDTVGGETRLKSWKVLKEDGILVSIVDREGATQREANQYRRRGVSFIVEPDANHLKKIAGLIDDGLLKPHLEVVLPLQDAAKAHQLSESRHVQGKIALLV